MTEDQNDNLDQAIPSDADTRTPFHDHDGKNSPRLNKRNFQNIPNAYNSQEYDNGSVTGTATIDWSKSNAQYVTMTGNTTFTFIGARPGERFLLHIAGAYTPTLPSTVRYAGGTTPTPTASAGKKDIYAFVYCGKEGLYDCIQSANFATT